MKKTLLLLALLIWTGMQAVMAQSFTVKGKVVDENGEGLPFASVQIKGTNIGALTTADGSFSLNVPEDVNAPVLLVRTNGFADNQQAVSSGMGNLIVHMNSSASKLTGVIITGYGETTKEKYVGAADNVSADHIEKFPVTNVTQAIEGAAPGIQITNGGGDPGNSASGFQIRGMGSISASTSPLFVVDGSPYSGDINAINPQDIQNVTILKDATATSLYGSRGANGVIVITTKRGQMGEASKPKLSLSANIGIVRRGLPEYNIMTNEADYYGVSWDGYRRLMESAGYSPDEAGKIASGVSQFNLDNFGAGGEKNLIQALGGYNSYNLPASQLFDPVTGALNPNAQLRYHDNWEDDLSRTGLYQNYNLAVSGATEKSDYYYSFGYTNQDGYVKFSNYDRFTGRMNVNTQITSWLKGGLNASGSFSHYRYTNADGSTSGGYNPFYAGRSNAPIYPVYYYNADNQREIDPLTGLYKFDWGDLALYPESSMGDRQSLPNANVLGSLSLDRDVTTELNALVIPYLEAKFLKHFTAHIDINANYYNSNETEYNNTYYGQFAQNGGLVSKTNINMLAYTAKEYLRWDQDFGKHSVSVTLDHENYYMRQNSLGASGTGLVLPGLAELGNTTIPGTPSSVEDNERLESYLALGNYSYDGKYFLSASFRRDGSSIFSPDKRWGSFWAVGAGWNMNEENFLRDQSWIDVLKLKASYGTQGNNRGIGLYPWQSNYDIADFTNGTEAGGFLVTLANADLTWESSKQFNVGTEFSFWKSRLGGEVNFYVRTNKGLLFNVPLAPSLGVSSILANTATLRNTGVEITVYSDIVRTKDFTWNASLNVTHNRNNIAKMPDLGNGVDSFLSGNYNHKAGHSWYDFYLPSGHVNPADGDYLYGYVDSNGVARDTSDVGYAMDHGGRSFVGTAEPKLYGSLTNTFHYKNFDLSFLFTFSLGGSYYDAIYQSLMSDMNSLGGSNYSMDMLNRWTPENPNSDIPRIEFQNSNITAASDRWLVSSNYLSMRNLNFGYTLKPDWIKAAGFTSLRVSLSVDNVFLISARKGMDPQATFNGNPTYTYSPSRTVVFGVNLGL